MESRSIRAALPAFVLFFLLSLVELINDTMVSARNPHWRPGFWDAGTARVIVAQVSNMSSAYILGSSLRTLSPHEAIRLNIGSILLATIATYASCKAVTRVIPPYTDVDKSSVFSSYLDALECCGWPTSEILGRRFLRFKVPHSHCAP
ncbi:hypothetical protein FOXG_14204 [Fusarium oxysporum f. sp. lycopersici 4287]|uniref:Uncharacterized protein n=2 Tax=Fusarium oxysporum TaxID=5507 RepID=A0A0J9WTD4_FUSO4|nr:hypothetical protein FOXG_14204 [Fusarium oxysporum f. sp. lycopersici 4287]KNB15837.1 hypothetical protein FOXG_14204 [Fusarium oxysporum f. sp. lycopersici 4287]